MLAPVPEPADVRSTQSLPLVWRIPPWQPAVLILLATVLLGLVSYGHFSLGPEQMMGLIAAAALVCAGFALRLLLVADDDGIWVRRVLREQLVEWRDVASVEMTALRGSTVTVRITRANGSHVDVPPSLLLPTLPTSIRKVRSVVHRTATELGAIAAGRQA